MTPEEKQAARVSLGQAYAQYMAESAGVRARLSAEFKMRLQEAIETELHSLDARMGRAIARNPLPVREKQRITSSTNWYRYQRFVEAAGEVDISSREGRLQQKLDTLKNEFPQKTASEKTGENSNPPGEVAVKNVTSRFWDWQWGETAAKDFSIPSDAEVYITGEDHEVQTLWIEDAGEVYPIFEIHAGDDDWEHPTRAAFNLKSHQEASEAVENLVRQAKE